MERRKHTTVNGGTLKAAALACCLLPLSAPAFAQGGRPGSIFDFGAGARPMAMGGGYTAAANDANSIYYNPAGLGMLSGGNAALMHAQLFEGASYDYLGYAGNFSGLPGGWGVEAIRLSAGSAEGRDELNNRTSDFSYSETAGAAGAGLRGLFLPLLSAGAAVKITNRSMDGSSDRLLGLDLGAQYGPLLRGKLSLGLALQNVAALSSGDTSDRLKPAARFGAAWHITPGFSLAADLSDSGAFRVGTEYMLGPGALRTGFDAQGISFGAGIKFMKAYQFDMAVVRNADLGLSNRFSLNYYFGGHDKQPRTAVYAKDYLEKAAAAIKAREYLKALGYFELAQGMDAGVRRGPWGEKGARLAAAVKGLKLAELPERGRILAGGGQQAAEAGLALGEYIEGNSLKAVLLAHSALGYRKDDALYGEVLSMLVRLTSFEFRKDEILPRALLVQFKLEKSASVFYEQRFDEALGQCEEVLLLAPENALAWTRLGSVYFAMGESEKARKAYEKALELDPSDEQTANFMRLQGWR